MVQYTLLYCALLSGQSYLVEYFVEGFVPIVGALLLVFSVLLPRFWHFRDMTFLCFVLFLSVVIGTYVGGVGVGMFLKLSCTILLLSTAATIDLRSFPKRMVRIVVFFALISLIVYIARLMVPGFYYLLPLSSFESQGTHYSMEVAASVPYSTKGVLLFSVREGEMRNIGFFTEPGVYQGVLNGVVFYLFFFRSKLGLSARETALDLAILLAALLTCGSTTGYITFLVLFVALLLTIERGGSGSMKSRLILFGVLIIAVAVIDFFVRGNDSFVVENIIEKIFIGKGGSADLTGGNGGARLETVVACLELLSENPLGVGYDTVQAYKSASAVGAGLFVNSAALGILFLVALLWWLFAPIFKGKLGMPAILAYLVMYLYFSFSQVLLLPPVIISIPIYLALSNEEVRRESPVAL